MIPNEFYIPEEKMPGHAHINVAQLETHLKQDIALHESDCIFVIQNNKKIETVACGRKHVTQDVTQHVSVQPI